MNIARVRWLSLGLMALAVLLLLIGVAGGEMMTAVLGIAGLVVFVVSCVVQFALHRCPHCGRFLDRNYWGDHCQYCGNLLREARKQ